MEPSSPPLENFLYSRKRKPRKNSLHFRKRKPKKNSLYFRKLNFLIFREEYIQNPSIFRTRNIFRTLAYLELEAYSKPEAYSDHCQTSTMECFAKIAT